MPTTPVASRGNETWRCIYCGEVIAEAERKTAPRALLVYRRQRQIGRAHAACKARAIAEGKR